MLAVDGAAEPPCPPGGARAEGLDALTMRALGRRLGMEGMALYTYFRSKSDLHCSVAARRPLAA